MKYLIITVGVFAMFLCLAAANAYPLTTLGACLVIAILIYKNGGFKSVKS